MRSLFRAFSRLRVLSVTCLSTRSPRFSSRRLSARYKGSEKIVSGGVYSFRGCLIRLREKV